MKHSHYQFISNIDKMLTELPSDMNGISKIPATGHLFNINPDATKLPEDKAQLFYLLVQNCSNYVGVPGRTSRQ